MNNPIEKKNAIVSNPTQIPIEHKCKGIVAGPSHSYAIADQQIYLWGKKHNCEMIRQERSQANSKQNQQLDNESIITLPIAVDYVSTGKSHTFAWNKKQVYCWGSNQFYELGQEEQRDYGIQKMQLFQKALEQGYKLKNISCGQHHTLTVFNLETGKQQQSSGNREQTQYEIYEKPQQQQQENAHIQMFAWGQSQSYQLTINTLDIIPYPVLSPYQVYSKSDYNIALCNGKAYSWGCNIFSRLGQLIPSSQLPKIRIPKQVLLPEKIVKIGIGTYHVVAVAESGNAYSWGKGNQGQLGIDKFQAEGKPLKIICSEKIKDVCCGESHTMVLLQDGRLMTCGSNSHGALGHNSYDPNDKKKRSKKLAFVMNLQEVGEIIKICCGSSHNLILNKEGSVFGWGSNEAYQVLPLNKQNFGKKPKVPRGLLEIKVDNQKQVIKKENGQIKNTINCQLHIQRLQDWKRRYNSFKQSKNRQQQIFMQEFQQIMQLFGNKPII